MLTCRKASELLSRSLDEPLPLGARLRLKLHVSLCSCCHSLGDNLQRLQKAVKSSKGADLSEKRLKALKRAIEAGREQDKRS